MQTLCHKGLLFKRDEQKKPKGPVEQVHSEKKLSNHTVVTSEVALDISLSHDKRDGNFRLNSSMKFESNWLLDS